MRSYPRNSPHAAARLVALALIADGHVCPSEVQALRRCGFEAGLGLGPQDLGEVLQALCEDLLQMALPSGSLAASVESSVVEALAREVDDPALRQHVLAAIAAAAAADGQLADGEEFVLEALQRQWRAAPLTPGGVPRARSGVRHAAPASGA